MIERFLRWLLDRLQRRCQHFDSYVVVVADILEGALVCPPSKPDDLDLHLEIQWCRHCGAHRFVYSGFPERLAWRNRASEWRRPRPLWSEP